MTHAAPSWLAEQLLERDLLPDRAIRSGIRRIIAARAREQAAAAPGTEGVRLRQFAAERSRGPIAPEAAQAKSRQCEAPAEFYRLTLGPHLKYSSALWEGMTTTLEEAEAQMLALTADRAGLADGQRILDLGCGWGSLSLWMARRYRHAEIVGVSHSAAEKIWIDAQARREGLTNLQIVTADMNAFDTPRVFDRVVSVEMFEHLRNWRALLGRIARWLGPDGRLFVHSFTHRDYACPYDARDRSDWMAAYFSADGIMPADRLMFEFQEDLVVREHWTLSGVHYQKTVEAWLANMDRHKAGVMRVLRETYGEPDARRRWARWRVFFMACAESWGWHDGQDWLISHYLLTRR